MSQGTVFNLQRFSLQDGPGLRSTVFMKGCPLACLWCHNPESRSPRPEVVNWADQVLTAYADSPAIIVTHAYLYSDGQRYNHVGRTCQFSGDCISLTPPGSNPQCWNPICYLADGTDGEMLWNSLVKLHSNILFVFSGHVANPAPFDAARLSSTRPDGTVCHQMLADFQSDGSTGGGGYFRLLRIWRDGRVQV